MYRGAVLLTRQHLAEPRETHRPWAERREAGLEGRSDARGAQRRLPTITAGFSLKAVAANEARMA